MGASPVGSAGRGLHLTGLPKLVLIAAGIAAFVVVVVLVIGVIRAAQPGVTDIDELAGQISDVDGYECKNRTDVGDTVKFDGGTAVTRYCSLTRDGRQVFGEGDALEMVVVTPRDAMGDFVAYNRSHSRSRIPAIVGENWFIPGLGGAKGEPVRRALLKGLDGAREGSYGVFPR